MYILDRRKQKSPLLALQRTGMYPRYHLDSDISHGMPLDGTGIYGPTANEYRFTVTGEPGVTYSHPVITEAG